MTGFELDWRSWSFWIWWLHAFAAYCLVGFVYYWFRLNGLERAARDGLPRAIDRYNHALRGFPQAVFAKMMGKTRLKADPFP